MGLLSGHHDDTTTGHGHRYSTRSHGPLSGPGTTAGVTNTSNSGGLLGRKKNANVANTNTSGGFLSGGRNNGANTNTSGGGFLGRNNGANTNTSGGLLGRNNGANANNTGGLLGSGRNAGANTGGNMGNNAVVSPVSNPTAGHASSTVTGGKIQEGFGKVLHSRTMQNKGAQKVQRGEQEKIQAGHLREADRLENEAVMRRDMAGVQHGVHSTAGNVRGGLRH